MSASLPRHPPYALLRLPLQGWRLASRVLDALRAPALLAARLYVSYVFFHSGLQTLANWQGTVWLYQNEFHVLLLPPLAAALVGSAGELLLPPFVALGLGGRFAATGLFVVNAVALLSYMYALQPAAIELHYIWGSLIASVALWGPGSWSVDAWLRRAADARSARNMPAQ
jgi:putative oxidoreductase